MSATATLAIALTVLATAGAAAALIAHANHLHAERPPWGAVFYVSVAVLVLMAAVATGYLLGAPQ